MFPDDNGLVNLTQAGSKLHSSSIFCTCSRLRRAGLSNSQSAYRRILSATSRVKSSTRVPAVTLLSACRWLP
eukprot:7196649-Pyramimonas_sp.AAC.1